MEQNQSQKAGLDKNISVQRMAQGATIDEFLKRIRSDAMSNNHVSKIEVRLFEGSFEGSVVQNPLHLVYESQQRPYEVQQEERTGTIDLYL